MTAFDEEGELAHGHGGRASGPRGDEPAGFEAFHQDAQPGPVPVEHLGSFAIA